MAQGTRIGSVVIFVQDLGRSVDFYQELLELEVTDRSATAALLTSGGGSQLILRAMGGSGGHALGAVGVQYPVWLVAGKAELDRCEQVLRRHSAHRDTRVQDDVVVVEGRDPDGIVALIMYPGPDQAPMRELPVRIYAW